MEMLARHGHERATLGDGTTGGIQSGRGRREASAGDEHISRCRNVMAWCEPPSPWHQAQAT